MVAHALNLIGYSQSARAFQFTSVKARAFPPPFGLCSYYESLTVIRCHNRGNAFHTRLGQIGNDNRDHETSFRSVVSYDVKMLTKMS